mmetsp:Transcript_18482/g.32776  ORF Transcript_18482/g.32776 Transcript_18482/m.32776 type:complete len:202 (+) Transcript_18482:171-776(+)
MATLPTAMATQEPIWPPAATAVALTRPLRLALTINSSPSSSSSSSSKRLSNSKRCTSSVALRQVSRAKAVFEARPRVASQVLAREPPHPDTSSCSSSSRTRCTSSNSTKCFSSPQCNTFSSSNSSSSIFSSLTPSNSLEDGTTLTRAAAKADAQSREAPSRYTGPHRAARVCFNYWGVRTYVFDYLSFFIFLLGISQHHNQ